LDGSLSLGEVFSGSETRMSRPCDYAHIEVLLNISARAAADLARDDGAELRDLVAGLGSTSTT